MQVWEHPQDYLGFSPDGDYVVYAKHRDSEALARSNYERIFEDLKEAEIGFSPPEDLEEPRDNWVYDWRAAHWAVGWVEYIMVRGDAPQSIVDAAQSIADALEDYPVYDEEHFSDLEFEEVCEHWRDSSLRERISYAKEAGCSIFAARTSNPFDYDGLADLLRE